MFCGNCGGVCPDGSLSCPNCGSQLPPTLPPPVNPYSSPYDAPNAGTFTTGYSGGKPESYLVYSIVSTIFTSLCCWIPIGVVPLIYSVQSDSKFKAGDIAGSLSSAKKAMIWNWVSLGIFLLYYGSYIAIIAIGILTS